MPLTGGGTATFEFTDLFAQPIADIPVVPMENKERVTVLVMPQEKGYAPLIASVPAADYAGQGDR